VEDLLNGVLLTLACQSCRSAESLQCHHGAIPTVELLRQAIHSALSIFRNCIL